MGYYSKQNRKRKILGHKSKGKPNRRCSAKRITEIFSSTSLENKRCFLVGGGPSLKGFDYFLLKDEFSIGVNKAFTIFSPTINYAMDLRFYNHISRQGGRSEQRKINKSWIEYKGYKVFLCPKRNHSFSKDVFVVDRILGKTLSLDVKKGIYPGKNSGFGALMLAVSMGAKKIFLLGYDMKINNRKTHWHRGYINQEPETFGKKLEKFKEEFEEFSSLTKKEGIEVVNLGSDSALTCFPREKIENVFSKKGKK